jgi:Domain of unknown function (DUF4402)
MPQEFARKVFTGAAILLLAGAAPIHAQAPRTGASASAAAQICQPVATRNLADLNFGALVASANPGRVVLGREGGRSASGGVALASGAGVSSATFQVTGEPSATFSLSLPASVLITSGGNRMTVGDFTTGGAIQRLDPKGLLTLAVGATLGVNANQPAGLYAGSFTLTVAYQ